MDNKWWDSGGCAYYYDKIRQFELDTSPSSHSNFGFGVGLVLDQ